METSYIPCLRIETWGPDSWVRPWPPATQVHGLDLGPPNAPAFDSHSALKCVVHPLSSAAHSAFAYGGAMPACLPSSLSSMSVSTDSSPKAADLRSSTVFASALRRSYHLIL